MLQKIEHIAILERQLEDAVKYDTTCQKLMKLEEVGLIGALGLAPRLGQSGHISKRNADKRLRSTLFQGALSVITQVIKRPARVNKEHWLQALVERRRKNRSGCFSKQNGENRRCDI